MPIATGTALLLGGLAGAGTSIAGGIEGSKAASNAAQTQSQAESQAAQLQAQAQANALTEQEREFNTGQKNIQPYLEAGTSALGQLSSLMQPGGQLTQNFTAPTDVTEGNDPGYQFRLQQGQQALERAAAARGNTFSGGTLKALDRYNQDYASNEYGNVYNRAFNEFQTNQANLYNRLAGVAGTGQTAANTLNSAGQNYANNVSNILQQGAQGQSNALENAAAARASGYVGGANAWNGALGGVGSNLTNTFLLQSLMPKGPTATNTNSAGSYNPNLYTGLES